MDFLELISKVIALGRKLFKIIRGMNVCVAELDAIRLNLRSEMAQGLLGKAAFWFSTASVVMAGLAAEGERSLFEVPDEAPCSHPGHTWNLHPRTQISLIIRANRPHFKAVLVCPVSTLELQ